MKFLSYSVPVAIVGQNRTTGERQTIADRVLVSAASPSDAIKGAPSAAGTRCASLYGHLAFLSATVTSKTDVWPMDPRSGAKLDP